MGRRFMFGQMILTAVCMLHAWSNEPLGQTTSRRPPKAIIQEIARCCTALGAQSFKDRQKAARRLVELASLQGEFEYQDTSAIFPSKTPAYTCIVFLYRHHVCERLRSLYAHDDPEVAERARDVFHTIFPLYGLESHSLEIVIHNVNRDVDTLEGIAKAYDSHVSWIKKVNRGLGSDWSLHRLGTIRVPIRTNDGNGMIIDIGN